MSVTLDDFSDDRWGMVSDTMQTGRFSKEVVRDYPELHQYVLCGLNEDGSAGAPEPRDAPDREKPEVPKWSGDYDIYGKYADGKPRVGGSIEGRRGNLNAKGEIDIDQHGNVTAKVGVGGKF